MTELTPEERQKIYEEEKARLEIQQQLQAEQRVQEQKKKGTSCFGCLTGLIIIFFIIGAIATSTATKINNSVSHSASTLSASTDKPDLELLENHSISGEYSWYIAGTVKNNTTRTYNYVQVQANLYDKAGNQVGSTMSNTNNLRPGQKWKFKATVLEDDAHKYEITSINGF